MDLGGTKLPHSEEKAQLQKLLEVDNDDNTDQERNVQEKAVSGRSRERTQPMMIDRTHE